MAIESTPTKISPNTGAKAPAIRQIEQGQAPVKEAAKQVKPKSGSR